MAHDGRRGFADVTISDIGYDGIGPLGWVFLHASGAAPAHSLAPAFPSKLGLSFSSTRPLLLQDGLELAAHKGAVSTVELPRPFRSRFLGATPLPRWCSICATCLGGNA